MIIRTLRAAVRHPAPIGCRAAVREGLARPGSPPSRPLAALAPLPPPLQPPPPPQRPRAARAAKALASLKMAPDQLEGRADPGAGPPERTAQGPGPALTRPIPCAWGGGRPRGPI